MNKLVLLVCIISHSLLANTVYPETKTAISVSAIDINRVSCQGGQISSVDYAKGSGLTHTVHQNKKNAIFLFQKLDKGGVIELASVPISVLIGCNGYYYPLVFNPAKIDTQSVNLSLPTDELEAKEQIKLLTGLSHEDVIVQLIKRSRKSTMFSKNNLDKSSAIFLFKDKVKLQLHQIYQEKIPGTPYQLLRFVIVAKNDINNLNEKDFLSNELSHDIAAASLDSYHLKANEWTILHLIEVLN